MLTIFQKARCQTKIAHGAKGFVTPAMSIMNTMDSIIVTKM